MNSIDIIDECVAEKEELTVTVGVFENNQPRFIVFGGGGAIVAPVEHDYELCNVTEVFTAALANKLITEGELSLLSPLSAFLGNINAEKDFTVKQLITHTTGLALPLTLRSRLYAECFKIKSKPLLRGGRGELLELLSKCKAENNVLSSQSKLNYALLGEIIAAVKNKSCAEQLSEFIAQDLKLTGFRLSDGKGTLLTPYLQREADDAFIASDGLVANVTSCLRFLHMVLMQNEYLFLCTKPACEEKTAQGYALGTGWMISNDGLVWQSGTNSGFNSFFGVDFEQNRAACVLSNTPARAKQSAAEAGLLYLREKKYNRELVFM